MIMTAIEISGLTKKYKDVTAVDNMNLKIEDGELFALLGVNGAGKSTLIKMMSCLAAPTSGDAKIFGSSILTGASEVKKCINVSPQETAVAPNLSVRENLEFIAGIYGVENPGQRAAREIEEMGLSSVAGKKAKMLSGGWQRRLSIAMALISEPKLLFLDEPTLGPDVIARRELWSVIASLKNRTTVILTTHYLEEAESLSDRIGIMAHGALIACGTATELVAMSGKRNFEDAFVALAGGENI